MCTGVTDKTGLTLAVLAHPCDVHGSTSVAGERSEGFRDAESGRSPHLGGLPGAEFLLHKGDEVHGIKCRALFNRLGLITCIVAFTKKGVRFFLYPDKLNDW